MWGGMVHKNFLDSVTATLNHLIIMNTVSLTVVSFPVRQSVLVALYGPWVRQMSVKGNWASLSPWPPALTSVLTTPFPSTRQLKQGGLQENLPCSASLLITNRAPQPTGGTELSVNRVVKAAIWENVDAPALSHMTYQYNL